MGRYCYETDGLGLLNPTGFASEGLGEFRIMENEHHLFQSLLQPSSKANAVSVSSQTEEFIVKIPYSALFYKNLNRKPNINYKDRSVDEISICISHLSLDSKHKKKYNNTLNFSHAWRETKNKHKSRLKRRLRNIDRDWKDMNGNLKHYDSLCSTCVFKTRNSNVFVKNENLEYELQRRANIQKISNGLQTCILQSFPIGELHCTNSVLIEEEPHISPYERLYRSLESCFFGPSSESYGRHLPLVIQRDCSSEHIEHQKEIVNELIEEDKKTQKKPSSGQNTDPPATRKKKKRKVKRNSKALQIYRSEQNGSYSTDDTFDGDIRNGQHNFDFPDGQLGWFSGGVSESNHRDTQITSDTSDIRQPCHETHFVVQKNDGLIEEIPQNSNKRTSRSRSKKRKRILNKIPKAPKTLVSEQDYSDDTDSGSNPQNKSFQCNQNLSFVKRIPKTISDTELEEEQGSISSREEMLEPSTFNFSSDDYNLTFPKCSSFVLIMGNQLGKYPGISSSMETLSSTSGLQPAEETSKNEEFQDLSHKMEEFSLDDQEQEIRNVQERQEVIDDPLMQDSRSPNADQEAVSKEENNTECDPVFNFAAGDIRFGFKPSPKLKVKKIVYKKNRKERRLLFKSNKGVLYLKTIA